MQFDILLNSTGTGTGYYALLERNFLGHPLLAFHYDFVESLFRFPLTITGKESSIPHSRGVLCCLLRCVFVSTAAWNKKVTRCAV
jgi:hypothetical protein